MIATIAIAMAAGAVGGVLSFWGLFAFVEWVFASDKQRRRMRPRTLGPRGYRGQHYDPL